MILTNVAEAIMSFALEFIIFVCASAPAYGQAQASTATLSGSVSDKSGAAVSGALVELSNPVKGFAQTFTTQAEGTYVFPLLQPGTYTLQVKRSGFKSYIQSGIVLGVGQTASQDVQLDVGVVVQETVTVTAGADILNTTTANVGMTVTEHQAIELPLDVRNVFSLVSLNASVNNSSQYQVVNGPGQQDTADQDLYFMNFGGGRFGTTAVVLDGNWDVGGDWGGYMRSEDHTSELQSPLN